MKIEERLAIGTLVLRIILAHGGDEMAHTLREAGYGVTIVNGEGGQRFGETALYHHQAQKDLKPVCEK